jgi:radical SAM superfamily enzyme YgiQ (UPF0313 family)
MVTVRGGSTVSARVGSSLLDEYPFIDVVIQGEGEHPLVALLDVLTGGLPRSEIAGVLRRRATGALPRAARLWEVERLADLPIPDYDEYADQASEHGIDWTVPIEGSRGCWWDRARRTGNPRGLRVAGFFVSSMSIIYAHINNMP